MGNRQIAWGGGDTAAFQTRFFGKALLVSGDSITESNFRAEKNWHDYLKEDLSLSKVINDGKSGTGISRPYGNSPCMYDRMDSWGEADLILIMASLNDGGGNNADLPLGTLGDTGLGLSYYGDCRAFIEKLLAKYPLTPIGIISPPPRGNNQDRGPTYGPDSWYAPWSKALAEVCGAYSIPFLDLYKNSGLRPWLTQNNAEFFSCPSSPSGDFVHPNAKGQKIMAEKIRRFVENYL